MSWWFIYWITRLGDIRATAGVTLFIFAWPTVIFIGLYLWAKLDNESWSDSVSVEDTLKYFGRFAALSFLIVLFSLSILTFVPRAKEAAAIYLIPKMVNNEAVQEIPGDAVKLLQLKLDEWINDLSPGKATPKD